MSRRWLILYEAIEIFCMLMKPFQYAYFQVLLLIDASYGFEMETFEFLHICQVHGMPRIMGVLTHLDVFKNAKSLKKTKKILKHRFWTEVYDGAKLFYLSGIVQDQYMKNEIRNLARFISVMKFRPLVFRAAHPYVLADRFVFYSKSTIREQAYDTSFSSF